MTFLNYLFRLDSQCLRYTVEILSQEPKATGIHPQGELVRPVDVDLPFNKILPVQLQTTTSSKWPLWHPPCRSAPFLHMSQCPLPLLVRLLDHLRLMTSPQSCRRWLDICPSFKDSHWIHNLPSPLPLSVEIKSIAPLENSPLRPVLMNRILYSHQFRHWYLVVSVVLRKWQSPHPVYGIIPIKSEVAAATQMAVKRGWCTALCLIYAW